MSSFNTNRGIWSDIYRSRMNNLSYPNENLVRYFHYLFGGTNLSKLKLLDYGFGSGNNLKHLYRMGFDVYGVEISEHAKQMTLEKLGDGFDAEKLFLMIDEAALPYENETFDIVVAWQVLYYNSFESFKKVLNVIRGLLKPAGRFIGTMARMEDVAVVNSTPVEGYERILNPDMGKQAGSIILALPTEEDIRRIFDNLFENVQIGYFESSINNLTASHWIIYGEKSKP